MTDQEETVDLDDWRLVVRHLSGRSTEEEEERALTLLGEADERLPLSTLRDIWDVEPPPARPPDTETAVTRLRARIGADTPLARRAPRSPRMHARPGFLLRAAVLTGLALAGVEALVPSGVGDVDGSHQVLPPLRDVATAPGEFSRLVLSDGSRVFLAPSSRLVYPERLAAAARHVRLEGRAYLEVAADDRPFLVRSGEAITRVLGTRFAIRSETGEETVRVAVAEGRVSLRGDASVGPALTLAAGDLGVLHDGRLRSVPGGAADDLAWVRGRLVFRDASVARVLTELTRWFGFEFTAEPSLRSRLLTITIRGGSVPEVVAILETALGADAVKGDRSFHFVPR